MRGAIESYKSGLDPAAFASISQKSKKDQRGLQTYVKGSIVGFMRDKLLKNNDAQKDLNNPIVDGIFAGVKATGSADTRQSPRPKAFVCSKTRNYPNDTMRLFNPASLANTSDKKFAQTQVMSGKANQRKQLWIDHIEMNQIKAGVTNDMIYGALPKAHISKMSFRAKSDHCGVYVRKYLPAADRAVLAAEKQAKAMQTELTFASKDPNKVTSFRSPQSLLEKQSRMRYKATNQQDRVQAKIASHNKVDFEKFNLCDTIIKPTYRTVDKNKWQDKNGFSHGQTNGGKSVWKQQDYQISDGKNPNVADPATLAAIILQKKRDPTKETSPRLFDSVLRKDNHAINYTKVNSLLSGVSLDAQMRQYMAVNPSTGYQRSHNSSFMNQYQANQKGQTSIKQRSPRSPITNGQQKQRGPQIDVNKLDPSSPLAFGTASKGSPIASLNFEQKLNNIVVRQEGGDSPISRPTDASPRFNVESQHNSSIGSLETATGAQKVRGADFARFRINLGQIRESQVEHTGQVTEKLHSKYAEIDLLQLDSVRHIPGQKTKVNILDDKEQLDLTTAHTSKYEDAKVSVSNRKCADAGDLYKESRRKPNSIVNNRVDPAGSIARASFNAHYKVLNMTQVDDSLIQMTMRMPKSYNKTMAPSLRASKVSPSEQNNRVLTQNWPQTSKNIIKRQPIAPKKPELSPLNLNASPGASLMSTIQGFFAQKVEKKADQIIDQDKTQEQENMIITEFLKKSKPKERGLKNTQQLIEEYNRSRTSTAEVGNTYNTQQVSAMSHIARSDSPLIGQSNSQETYSKTPKKHLGNQSPDFYRNMHYKPQGLGAKPTIREYYKNEQFVKNLKTQKKIKTDISSAVEIEIIPSNITLRHDRIHGSAFSTSREVKKQILKVHKQMVNENQINNVLSDTEFVEMKSKKITEIINQHPNIQKIENAETLQAKKLSNIDKRRINSNQSTLLKAIDKLQESPRTASTGMALRPNTQHQSVKADGHQIRGKIEKPQAKDSLFVMQDSTQPLKVNPDFRKKQLNKIVNQYF